MRTDTAEFQQSNQSSSQEPTFVVEVAFDDAGTDLIYLTSHTISGLTGNVFEGVLTDISGTTQKINPDKALSEIGSLSFSALDDGLTAKQREKLNAGLGLRGKRVRFYAGFQSIDWSAYTLVQTQIIRGSSYKDMEYSWKCSDIQREMRKNIFEVKSTSLAATLEPDATEVRVYNTEGFNTVKQPPSPSGKIDAPGQKVGYIILEESGQKEIIRYTGKTSTTFTGCTRGVLGTRPIRVEKSADEGADNAPKVEEYVYLEMPAPMLAYAILTGSIYGETGETLPDHWHLGIAPQYIRTSDYTNIGEDLWDLSNPDLGLPARMAGVTSEDGKQFVEEQLFLLMGCYAPIYANGEIGLRRMTGVLSNASTIRTLDRRNVMSYGSLEHDMKAIINRIVISWNWVDQREEYTRTNLLIDQTSIDIHGDADLKELEFRALHGSRHSYNTLRNRFDALRDRYAGPPLRISLDLLPDQNDLEVGDIVRLQLDEVEDYTGEVTGIDRAFEVQQVKVNWQTGIVSVDLFGSSEKAEPLPAEQEGAALPDGVYAVSGATEINATNFPGAVSSSNGITTVSSNIDLTGADDLRDASAIYYCLEDLTINAGVTVTVNKNTQIRVKGFFQINGKIDGARTGFPGQPALSSISTTAQQPTQRFFGITESQMGSRVLAPESGGFLQIVGGSVNQINGINWNGVSRGRYETAPELALEITDGVLRGLPGDLTGQPGTSGQVSSIKDVNGSDAVVSGGAGGNGGSGLFILSAGADFGSNGSIDTSGGDGQLPGSGTYNLGYDNWEVFGGRGASGMPGAVYWAIVGKTSNPPTLTNTTAIAKTGASSAAGYSGILVFDPNYTYEWRSSDSNTGTINGVFPLERAPNPLSVESISPVARYTTAKNLLADAHRVQFLNGEIVPTPDVPEYSTKPSAIVVTEALNTPKTPNANLSTLEVSVSAPADSAYSYALVEYRPKGDAGWTSAGPASPEALITVASDGTTYEIRAKSVSTSGVVSNDFVLAEITTTKIVGADPSDPQVDDQIVVPNVRGLELEGQGNGTEFTGRDAKFVWRATTVGEWFEIGSEGQLGASAGELDLYFRDYQVEIWAQNKVVRTEWVKDPAFVYAYEKNAEDYARENGTPGAWRSFEIRVYCRGRLNQVSTVPASLMVSNPAPSNITGLSVTAGFNVIEIAYKRPADLDFAGVQVWISTTSGFDPDAVEPTAEISDNSYVAGGLDQGQTYYVRIRPFDDFGIEGTTATAEIAVTTKNGLDLTGLSGWAYQIAPADRAFIEQNLANDAVPSQKVVSLTAAKLTTGTLNATESITAEGVIRAVDDINNPTVQVGIGPATLSVGGAQTSLLLWALNANNDVTFGVDELGNPYFSGTLDAAGGTFGDPNGYFMEFDGANLIVQTPFLMFDSTQAVLGNESSGEYIKYSNGVFEVGPKATIGNNANRIVTVGSSGAEYTSINAALEALSRTIPAYKKGGFTATVEVQSGYVESETIVIDGVDLGWITIKTADGSPISVDASSIGSTNDWFVSRGGANSPKVDFSVDIINGDIGKVFYATENSSIYFVFRTTSESRINIDCNNSNYGLYADKQSRVYAERVSYQNVDFDAITSVEGANIQAFDSLVDTCRTALSADLAGEIYAQQITATTVYSSGINAHRASRVHAYDCDITLSGVSSTRRGVNASASDVLVAFGRLHGWEQYGIYSISGAKVIADSADIRKVSGGSNSSSDAVVAYGSVIVKNNGYGGQSQALNAITSDGIIFG